MRILFILSLFILSNTHTIASDEEASKLSNRTIEVTITRSKEKLKQIKKQPKPQECITCKNKITDTTEAKAARTYTETTHDIWKLLKRAFVVINLGGNWVGPYVPKNLKNTFFAIASFSGFGWLASDTMMEHKKRSHEELGGGIDEKTLMPEWVLEYLDKIPLGYQGWEFLRNGGLAINGLSTFLQVVIEADTTAGTILSVFSTLGSIMALLGDPMSERELQKIVKILKQPTVVEENV